jgi:hypothetical protein
MARTAHPPIIKALTVKQPWAWAITHGTKRTENRTWAPPSSWSGFLALHAAKTVAAKDMTALANTPGMDGRQMPRRDRLVCGAVVALARVVDVHAANERTCGGNCLDWGLFPANPKTTKPLNHWCLADVTVLKRPVPCAGKLQLWTLPADVAAAVAAQTRRSRAWTA